MTFTTSKSIPALHDAADPEARRARGLEALYALSQRAAGSRGTADVLPFALSEVLEVFGFDCGVLRLLDPGTGTLTLAAQAGLPEALQSRFAPSIRAGDAPGGLAVQRRTLIVIDDLAESPYADSPWGELGARTFVSVPLQCQGMLLGCLNAAAREARALTDADRELLTALVNQIAMSVANAELFAAAQRKIQYLSALHQCSQDIGPAPDLDRVLRLTTERMAQLLHLDRTAVVYYLPEEDCLTAAAGFGFQAETLDALGAPLAALPAAAALLRGERVAVSEDAVGDGLLPAEFGSAAQLRSVLAVPLVAHDQVLGLLIGDRSGARLRLTADEMDLAMIFANQASVWLANARLFVREQAARAESEHSEARFRELLELAPDAIVIMNREGRIALVNGQAERMFGYDREELTGQLIECLLPERFRAGHVAHRNRYLEEPRTRPMGIGLDLFGRRKDGQEFPVELSLSPTLTDQANAVISVVRDISDRKQAEQERNRLLESERRKGEQLKLAIREAHHRIKNNLQAISDLLYLELASSSGEAGHDLLQESVERVQSIALVHDLLTQDEDVQTVDVNALAERLVPMVLSGAGRGGGAVELELSVPSIPLSSKKATTLALILNELVSNAVKHAFAGRQGGRLRVSLEQADEGLQLCVQDDGPGLPQGFEVAVNASVGLQVVRTLAERDLGGKLTLASGPGLTATVWFSW